MEPQFWWAWVVVGILLVVLEIFTAGFIVMWFGIAAIVTALPVGLGAPPAVIIATYAISLLILTVFVRKITIGFMSRGSGTLGTNVDALLGCAAVVVEEIDPIKGTGQVRVRKEVWTAVRERNEPLPVDSIVRIVGIQGAKLVVEKEEG